MSSRIPSAAGGNATEYAQVDATGTLVAAGERLRALNERAGGALGERLVVPQLARLARLTQTLGVPISRAVIAADGEQDVEIWVQTKIAQGGVELAMTGWSSRAPRPSWLIEQPMPADASPRLAEDWRWQIDAGLTLVELKLAASDVTEMQPSDVIGRPLTRLVRLIENDAGDMPILQALALGGDFEGQHAVRRDRPDVEYLLHGAAIRDAGGALTGYAGRAQSIVRSSEDTLSAGGIDFSSRLGEVMRAPLDRIVARAETISAQVDGPLRRDYADYAGDIASAGRHLLSLVDDLGDLQDVERPDFRIAAEPIDLADLARRAGGLLAVRAADRGVRIDRPDAGETLTAVGDFKRTLQILVNLVGNAVRYSPPGAMIWLRSERDGDSAVLIVADQGKGIDPDDQGRIFEKFERVDASEPGGSGLGLYISRRLARAMGGDITVDSAPGQGARFMLTLPAAR